MRRSRKSGEDEHRPLMSPKQRQMAQRRMRASTSSSSLLTHNNATGADTPRCYETNAFKTAALLSGLAIGGILFGLSFYAYYKHVVLSETSALAALAASGAVFGILALLLAIHLAAVHRQKRKIAALRNSQWTRHLFIEDSQQPRLDDQHQQQNAGEQETHPMTSQTHLDAHMSEAELFQEVRRLAHELRVANAHGNERVVGAILSRVSRSLTVTKSLLAATGIGKAVNSVRGRHLPEAQALVGQWIVAIRDKDEAQATSSAHDHPRTQDVQETPLAQSHSSLQQHNRNAADHTHVQKDEGKEEEVEEEGDVMVDENSISGKRQRNATDGSDGSEEDHHRVALQKLNGRLVTAARQGEADTVGRILTKLEQGLAWLSPQLLQQTGLAKSLSRLENGEFALRAKDILQAVAASSQTEGSQREDE